MVLGVWKEVECFKRCLVSHTSMEDRGAKSYLNCWGFSMLPRDRSCDILVGKKLAAFCPCPEARVKSSGLVPLAEEISQQSSVDSVIWILMLTLMKIYNEKEKAE